MNARNEASAVDDARSVDRRIVAQWVEMYEKTDNAIWAWRALLVWLDVLSPGEPIHPTLHRYLKRCIAAIEVGLVSPAERRAMGRNRSEEDGTTPVDRRPDGHVSATALLTAMGLWQKSGAPMAQRYLANAEDDRRMVFWRTLMEAVQRGDEGAPASKKAAYEVAAKRWRMTPGSAEQFVRRKERLGALSKTTRQPIRTPTGME